MLYWKRILAVVLIVMIAVSGTAVTYAAEEGGMEDAGAAEEPAQEPEPAQPTAEIVQEPTPALTPVPTQAPAAEATAAPPEPATPTPTEEPTPIQTEEQGTVNLTLYTFTDSDAPASGYSVSLGGYTQTSNDEGLVQFQNLPVGEYGVRISAPNGTQCTGRIYMSRGSATVLTEQAMGGTYGMNIQRGQHDIYMITTFVPDGQLYIRSLSNTVPSLPAQAVPEPVASEEIRYGEKTVTAVFYTEAGSPIPGLSLNVEGEGLSVNVETDSRGQVVLRRVPYGACTVTASIDGVPQAQFSLTMNPAQRTAIIANSAPAFVVDSSVQAQNLYLEFRQAGDTLLLTGASDEPVGGINSLLIGVLVVAGLAIVTIVLLVIARKRRRRSRTPRVKQTVRTSTRNSQSDAAQGQEDGVRRTGGANKFDSNSFDDRSRL